MRIVIDMQGAQGESKYRGIGRYAMAFAAAVIRNKKDHEVVLALNGQLEDSVELIRQSFKDILSECQIKVWQTPEGINAAKAGNDNLRHASELMRESFLKSLQPDVVHLTSLFEGYVDDAVTSVCKFDQSVPVSVAFYDLIPLLNSDHYLLPNPSYANFYHEKIEHLKRASLWLAISESSKKEGVDFLGLAPDKVINVSTAIDDCFGPMALSEQDVAQLKMKFDISRPYVLYTGGADSRKNLHRLIEAYAALNYDLRRGHQLVFAGKIPDAVVAELNSMGKRCGLQSDELIFTGYVSDEALVLLYNACELFVFPSWHEGFGLPALEAMACGTAVITSNTSSLPEVVGFDDAMFDPFNIANISEMIKKSLEDASFNARLCAHGLQQATKFSWDETAKRAIAAWETLDAVRKSSYLEDSLNYKRLAGAMAPYLKGSKEYELLNLSRMVGQNQQVGIERQLFVDVSELCTKDARTGVQRVVRSYLNCLLNAPPKGYRIEPVFASPKCEGYRYARQYTQKFLDGSPCKGLDEPIVWQQGDVFFGLDMQHQVQINHRPYFHKLRKDGVKVYFLIYDLLPIELPQYFECKQTKWLHEELLMMFAEMDGTVSISKATADKFSNWLTENKIETSENFMNTWVHIGADIEESVPTTGLPKGAEHILSNIKSRPSFLCVGTLEPRKGHAEVLKAFEELWDCGVDVNLVFVGKNGWLVNDLIHKLKNHRERNLRLFWLEAISDEFLEKVYESCTCLIAASYGEGFGLPLIEAAQHRMPIIARELSVFREIAGDSAYFFGGATGVTLSDCVVTWLELYKSDSHPKSELMGWCSWKESASRLVQKIVPIHGDLLV